MVRSESPTTVFNSSFYLLSHKEGDKPKEEAGPLNQILRVKADYRFLNVPTDLEFKVFSTRLKPIEVQITKFIIWILQM